MRLKFFLRFLLQYFLIVWSRLIKFSEQLFFKMSLKSDSFLRFSFFISIDFYWHLTEVTQHRRKELCNFCFAKKSRNYRFQRFLVRIRSENLPARTLVKFVVYSDIQGHLLSWLFLNISSERKDFLLNIKYSTFFFFSSFF